jgi:hypothetical protein
MSTTGFDMFDGLKTTDYKAGTGTEAYRTAQKGISLRIVNDDIAEECCLLGCDAV